CHHSPQFCVVFPADAARRFLPSFPTRRSSDLCASFSCKAFRCFFHVGREIVVQSFFNKIAKIKRVFFDHFLSRIASIFYWVFWRSEEHTSELQSLRHLVCRLLLEKKKQLRLTR